MTDSLGSVQEDVEGSHFTNDDDVKMHQIAMDIYNEFESILHAYGEKPLSTLVPLVANLLEMLNEFGLQKDKMAKELDMLKDHHTVLLSKYETAKVDAKVMEEHMFTLEDELHETKKKLETLKQANVSSQRLLELKLKNSIDQICRLEERESELRSAYANLRQRYGDLFRAHVEYLEKAQVSADTSRDSAEPILSGVVTKAGATLLSTELSASGLTTGISGPVISVSHKGDSPYDWGARKKIMQNICETTPELTLDLDGSPFSKFGDDKFDEVSVSEKSEGAEGDGLSFYTSSNNAPKRDSVVDFNVSREVSKLVKENNELEETKNALNVVIHDLLTQLEDLTVEKNQLKETLSQLQVARSGTQLHIAGLEQELTRLKKELNTVLVAQRNDEPEEGTPFSKRTRFTRDEMARVLLERNQLKEDLYELRESMRWSEVLQARRQDNQTDLRPWLREPGHRSGFLSFFSRLFRRPGRHSSVDRSTAGLWSASVSYENSSSRSTEGVRIGGQGTSGETSANLREPHPTRENRRRNSDTPRHHQVSRSRLPSAQPPSVCNGIPEKLTAASKGWIPAPVACRPCAPQPVVMRSMENLVGTGGLPPRSSFTSFSPPPLPTPLYRRPIPEALSNRMQISHATCTFQDVGSILPSGEVLAGRSTFFTPIRSAVSQPTLPTVIAAASSSSSAANQFGPASVWPTESGTTHLSSEVWMCLMGVVNAAATWTSEGHSASPDSWTDPQPAFCSQIVVVDATNPARYVESFSLPRSVVTAMTAVPGASVKDYDVLRYSHGVWETIPFVCSPPSHSQQSHQQQQQPHPVGSASRSQQSALGDAPPSPLLTESSSSIGRASITTNNALSSLQNFVTPGSADDGAGENRRSSAFQVPQPEAPGSSIIHQDFYRVERQHFYRHSCSSPSPLVGSSSYAGSRFCPLLTEAATAQQTVWLGCQNGDLFLHCSMTSRYRCLQTTRMPSGVTAICHFSGRVFVSLADGHIVVFRRQAPPATHASTAGFRGDAQMRADPEDKEVFATATATAAIRRSASQDTAITSTQHHLATSPDSSDCLRNDVSIGSELAAATAGGGPGGRGGGRGDSLGCALEGCWDLSEACVITCGPPQHAVKALVIVPPTLTVWAAYGNQILVIDTTCFQKLASFEVHPATTTQVKCMCWVRDGVWISLRRQPILRLFDAFSYSPLQEVDLSTILTQSLNSPNLCRPAAASVTALQASSDHLWVGTQSGVIAIAPFTSVSDRAAPPLSVSLPVDASTPIRNTASSALMLPSQDPVKPSAVVNFSETSVSLYGHSEAVNFLTIVSATGPKLEAIGITDTKVAPETSLLWNSNNSMEDFLMFSGGVGFVTHRVPSQSDSKPLSTGAAGGEGVQGTGAKEPTTTTTPPKATYESVGHLVAWSIPHREQSQPAPASST
ncbi:hypothetical protein SprV_0602121300 [Sparganum proliferum]